MKSAQNHSWQRVSSHNPCPICHKPDWCTVSTDTVSVCCMRVPSDKPASNGGFIHRLGELFDSRPAPAAAQPAKPAPAYMPADKVRNIWSQWAVITDDSQVRDLASALGVSPESLRSIGAGWAWPYDAWAFPMFDGAGEFRGIRLRHMDGSKLAVPRSRQGIFIPDGPPPADEICICEGPTDAAAMLTLGIFAVGRPSCNGGASEITQFCRRHKISRVTIIADNDGPGRAGAQRLAETVPLRTRVATLPAKDAREALRLGATRETVLTCINNATWRN